MPNVSRQVGLRLFVCFSALLGSALGLQDPWAMYPGTGHPGAVDFLNWTIGLLSLGGMADIGCNDTKLGRSACPRAAKFLRTWRDAGFLSVASARACLLFLGAQTQIPLPTLLESGLLITACVWIAIVDVKHLLTPEIQAENR